MPESASECICPRQTPIHFEMRSIEDYVLLPQSAVYLLLWQDPRKQED